ncbi:MAG: glycosyltransferase [Gaiellaceae bacterium]
MRIVFLGLSITSSWGNGHATNYRALTRALRKRGHDVLFLERDVPWYAEHRDDGGAGRLYGSLDELRDGWRDDVGDADLVVVGSYVPDGVEVARWALENSRGRVAFYDIDTPVTLAKLRRGDHEYLSPDLIPRFDVYLSFSGGPLLRELEQRWGARRAQAFYCLVDADAYTPSDVEKRWALGYLGTYSADRQPALEQLLLGPAGALRNARFCVAGPQYPRTAEWPANVELVEHLPPPEHPSFYSAQQFTLSVTRTEMMRAGWSPSVRLFEAGACAVPVITDAWPGVDELFRPGHDILVAREAKDVVRILRETPPDERDAIGERLRARVLALHTAEQRAEELEAVAA